MTNERINLFNNYYLRADSNQFIAERVEVSEKGVFGTNETTGEMVERVRWSGYYCSLEGAIKGCIREHLRQGLSDFGDTDALLKELETLNKTIASFLGNSELPIKI